MPDPLERVTNLLTLLLETRLPLTLDQITNEMSGYPAGAAARRGAFERDKAVLRDVGVPIDTEVLGGDQAGQTGYRIDRRRFELTGLELEDDERQALQLAVATVRSDVGQDGVWKLGGSVVGAVPIMAEVPQLEQLPALRSAVSDHYSVDFDYRRVRRRLDPYGLLLRSGFWYVIGHDHGHDEHRTYRVDRIDGDVVVDPSSTFTRPSGFDLEASFPADPKLLGDGQPIEATVWVGAHRAGQVIRELGGSVAERVGGGRSDDGSVVVTVPAANVEAFRSWVLGLGVHAEVLGPPEVRRAFVEWLRDVAGRSRVRT